MTNYFKPDTQEESPFQSPMICTLELLPFNSNTNLTFSNTSRLQQHMLNTTMRFTLSSQRGLITGNQASESNCSLQHHLQAATVECEAISTALHTNKQGGCHTWHSLGIDTKDHPVPRQSNARICIDSEAHRADSAGTRGRPAELNAALISVCGVCGASHADHRDHHELLVGSHLHSATVLSCSGTELDLGALCQCAIGVEQVRGVIDLHVEVVHVATVTAQPTTTSEHTAIR